MQKALIKIAFKQIIDANSKEDFERKVFNDSYEEFKIQMQTYNVENKYKSFHQVLSINPKSQSVHYKVGFAVGLYIKELNSLIHGLRDSLGRMNIPFFSYQFEIIESDLTNKSVHRVAITYFTDELTLINIIGPWMLLAIGHASGNRLEEEMETFLLRIEPNLSITSYKELKQPSVLAQYSLRN